VRLHSGSINRYKKHVTGCINCQVASFVRKISDIVSFEASHSSKTSNCITEVAMRIILLSLLLPCQLSLVLGLETPAHVLATPRQLLTSSTLSWADISRVQSGQIPGDRVVVSGHSAVCRVRDGDKLRPGRTDRSGLCVVEGVKERQYQVLVDMTGKARLEWRDWDMFSNPEKGTVAYNDKTFVAQIEITGFGKTIGDLDFTRGLNGEVEVYLGGGKVERRTSGLALVELEPVKYRLEDISFLAPREISSTVLSLGTVHMVSMQEDHGKEWEEEQDMVEYTYSGYEHWGHISGTVRGLPASAMVGKTLSFFRWGLEEKNIRREEYMVRYSLRHGTGVNITLSGHLVRKEEPYTAQLVMVYKDGALTRHNVSSIFISVSVENITQDIRGPYFLKSGLPAPTTTRRPTSTPPPTTPSPLNTIPPHAHMFLAPTPPPTLFPPPPPPVTKPNPLRQFYPDTEYSSDTDHSVTDHVRVTVMSTAPSALPGHHILTVLVIAFVTFVNDS